MTNEEKVEGLHPRFKELAEREGVSLLSEEDWMPSYVFWVDGYITKIYEEVN